MRSIEEIKNKAWKDRKDIPAIDTGSVLNTSFKLFDQYREATKPKVTGGTVNPTISYGNVRENPVLKRKENTAKTYSQALEESRNRAKTLEMGAKLPTVIPPKGDVSKLILPDTGGGGTVNPTLKRNEVRTNYDYMTDREAAVYKYYRDRGQVEKAQEYLDALEMDVNQRAAMQKREDAKKLAEESTAAALYARAVGNIGQAAGAVYAAAMEGADKPVDPYHPLMGGVNMNEGLYEGLMGQSTGANKVFKDIGLGIFDWGTQAATLGPLTPYVMAAGAAAGNTKEALERGGTTDEAVMYGLAGGAAEAITEKLGYDRLFELGKITKNKGAVSTFLKSLLPQAASEGAEEATSEIANLLADTLIMGDNSQMKQIAQTAMENGATESEAVKTALMEGIKQVGYSGAVGAASGGVIAGGIGGLSRAKGRNALEMAGNPAGVAREAMTNAGKEVTKRINDMRSQGKAEVPEGTTQENVLPEQGNALSNRENMLPEQGNVMVNRENVPEGTQENKALRDFGEKYYYTEGQKLVNEEAERRGDTSFIPAFQTYYTAGLTGMKESDIKQTAETIVADKGLLSAAYLAGVNDRKADLEARMKGTGKMGQTVGVFLETDAVTKEQRSLAELVSRVAELEVVLVDELPQDRRGYYENNKGRVTIALNSGQFAGTLFHESIHYIREANPEGFDRLRQVVFSAAAAKQGMDLESYTQKYEKMYGEAYQEAGQKVDYDMILEEMTADAFAEVAGDEKTFRTFVKEMQNTNPSVLEKIKEFLENLLETLKGLVNDGRFSSFGGEIRKDVKTTEKFAKMLAEEMKKAGEMQRGEKTEKKGEKKEKKYSFAGEKARTADREKLDMAKKMEEEGKTPERIYEETGWFRGLDQKWKFEIDDSAAEFFPEGDAILQNNPSYKKFREMMENGETNKPEFWSLWEIFEGEIGREEKSLSFYLKHEKLFEKYPFLSYVKIRIEDMSGKNREGYYDPVKNEIVLDGSLLNQYTKEKTKGILLHEIQHAIQKYEGFTQGSNTKAWEDVRTEIKEILAGAVRNRDLWLADIGYNDFVKKSMMQVAKKEKTMQEHWEDVKKFKENSEFAKQIEASEKEVKYYEKHLAMVSNLADGTWANANEMYWNTAGEIEARAVAERKDLTEEERRKEKVNLNREKAVFAENLNEMAKKYGVRFSLKEPIEETKDLIAVHNMNEEDLKRTLQLGGMPMPSIAIVKGKMGHENFGEISLVFGKDTIDPEGMKENRVYGSDAWTPTVPQIDYEVDSKKEKAFENEVGERASRFADGIFSSYSVLRSIGVDESTRKTENEVAKELAGQDAVIAAYLEEQGEAMEPVYEYKEKSYDRHGNDALRAYIQKKGTDELRKLVQDMESGAVDWMEAVQGEMDRYREAIEPELRKRAQGFFKSRPAEAVEKKVTERLKKEMVPNRVREFIEHAWELQSKPAETEGQVDRNATREKMRKMVDAEAVEKWVKEKTKGMLGEAGIYNGKDPYTPSGKQRTFAQLHYAYTLENLVKAMKGNQQEKGEGLWGATARGLQAVTSREYGSIAEIRGDKGRLKQVDEGEYKAELEAIDREIESIVSEIKKTNKAHSDNTYTESDIIGAVMLEAAQGRHTKAAIKKAFANNDYDISDMVAGKMANVFESVMELPTTYFEAKPQRAVMVDEIRAAIVPDDLGADVVEQMEKAGVPLITYEAGNEESRKEALNSVEGVRFSIREEAYDALVEENEALKEANEALRRQFEITKDAVHDPVSAKKAVRKWLKSINSTYDVDIFTEKFLALADYVANAGDQVDMQMVMAALQKLAYDALSESKVLNTDLSDAYKDFKEDVRKTKIKVTDSMLEELEYYGGYIEFRKRNFGKLNLSRQSGIPADVFYQEMAEKYPGLLKEGNVKTQVDILIDLANTVDSLQPIYENPYGMNLDEYAMDAAYDLWEMYFDIEMQKPTFADKYEKKVEQLQIENQKLKAAKNKMRQEMKERHEEQMEKAKAEANKKLEEEREKYIRQVDVLLEEKYKLRQKLETQWKAHKNSMVEAQRTELARLIAEGKKTAAEIRELKKDKKELKQRMDEVLEREDLWVQACQAILRENNKEINRYKKQVQRLKESKEKQRERAIRKYDRLLEAKFQLQDRQKKQSERRKYAKYRRIVEQETNKMLKWLRKPTDTYHVPEEMTRGLRELLTKIGTSDGEIMIMQNDLFQAIKDLERFRPKDGKEEADFFVEHDEQTIDSMNEFIGKYPNGFDLENLPADEMKELADILRSIHKRITNANKFISLFRQVEVREVSEKFLSESQKMKNTVQEGRTRQVLDFFNMDLVDPYSFFSGMGDSVRNTLFKATEEGFERKIRHEAEAEKFISGIVSKKEAAAWSTAAPTLYKIGGRDIYMTPAEVMSLYATYRRNQGILHLLTGGFKTAFNKLKRMTKKEAETRLENFKPYQPSRKELEDIFNTLTDKQKEVVEKAQDFLSNVVGGWGNETSMEMFGYKKFNDQRYFPISSDKDYINNVFGDPNQKQKALVNIAAAKPTSDQAKNPIVIEDFFTVFARQIDQMSSYNAFVPVISDWNKFMGYKKYSREAGVQEVESVKKEIVRTMGRGAISYIGKFLDDIQSVNTGEKAPITKTLVSNMKRASVGANLRVAIQQPVSIVRAADMISLKYLMMAFAKGKNDFEKIYEYAPIAQWKEWGHYDMNIARGLEERIRGQSILGKLSDYSMAMASWGDKFTWGRIWKAVEMETRDKYPDLKGERFDRKVGERFSEIINRTQVVDSMLHRSQIMREKTIYKQMTTSFMGEPIKTYNMMRNSIVALMKDNTKENRNKVVRSFVTLTFNAVAVAAAAAVVDALRDDDDDETWAEKWLEAFRGDYEKAESGGEKVMAFLSSNVGWNTNPFTYIPYLKDVVSLLQGFTVQRTDIGWVNDIIKSGNVLMQYIQGESPYTFTAVLANTAASLSKATGLPIASAKRDMEAIKNTVINQAMGLETQYGNKKLTYALGSEKNVSMYVKMMIDAKLSGNDKLATRIYNEMVNAGISNEKMESQLGNKEKEKIKKDSAAMEAVEAYAKKDYDTYTQKLDELRKKYSQKNIESTIRSMYEDKYGEEDIETFDKITQDFWEKEEEVESSQFKTVIDAMMEAKLSGKLGEATKLYNYMVNNGLPNDKLDSAIDSREKELLKNDPLTKEGVEAFHEGDADRYVDIVEQLKNKNYYARNVTSAIESMHDKLYGEDDEDTFETITQDFWEEDEADEMVSYELLFNAFWNGSRGTYNEVWGLLNAAGKEDKDIRASMRGKCYYAYWKADGEGDTEKMNKAAEGYQKNGGKLETLLKPPKE